MVANLLKAVVLDFARPLGHPFELCNRSFVLRSHGASAADVGKGSCGRIMEYSVGPASRSVG